MMKKKYETPSLTISLFELEEVLTYSNPNGVVVTPPTGNGSTEAGSDLDIGW